MLRKDCNTQREGNCREALPGELEMELFGMFANQFGALASHCLWGIWQDQEEFITAIPAVDILAANLPEQKIACR